MKYYRFLLLFLPGFVHGQVDIAFQNSSSGQFPLVTDTGATPIFYDASDDILIQRTATLLAQDIERVTDQKPKVLTNLPGRLENLIIIATVDNNILIKKLVADKKLDLRPLVNEWERFIVKTIKNPLPGVERALVIVGSDRRGAAYGALGISERIGVSPWYWWADVPTKKRKNLFVDPINYVSKGPSVKYRGIFLNDESPALRNWAKERFGGFNHKFYEKVYELLLRNKANYLWPAMWLPTAFADDDPLNPKTAHEYGIVISTSHHEPMMRAHDEWGRFGGEEWNYRTNKERLQEFWRGGVERMGDYESVVTVGMRGDGDEAMGEGAAIDLLQTIISDQRKIVNLQPKVD